MGLKFKRETNLDKMFDDLVFDPEKAKQAKEEAIAETKIETEKIKEKQTEAPNK